jgi:hypothetical protein
VETIGRRFTSTSTGSTPRIALYAWFKLPEFPKMWADFTSAGTSEEALFDAIATAVER